LLFSIADAAMEVARRHSAGTPRVGSVLFSTVLNLFFIPVLYVTVKGFLVSFSAKKKEVETREPVKAA
jgi:hypothetical protein